MYIEPFLLEISNALSVVQTNANKSAPKFSIFNFLTIDEVQLSQIIGDLLNPKGSHAQGSEFLAIFLNKYGIGQKDDWKPFRDKIDSTEMELERCTIASRRLRRMDIYLSCTTGDDNYGICIENKPFAKDQENQLNDYANYLHQIHGSKMYLIYLLGSGNNPSNHSISKADIETLVSEDKFKLVTYVDLVPWLERCIVKSQNDRVSYFLKEFIKYIQTEFMGVRDMSEQQAITKKALENSENLKAALAVMSTKDEVLNRLLKQFETEIYSSCAKEGWNVQRDKRVLQPENTLDYWNKPKSGLNISFGTKEKNPQFSFRIEFEVAELKSFVLGIYSPDGAFNIKDDYWIEIGEVMKNIFPERIKGVSGKWAFWNYQKSIRNWSLDSEAWLMIQSGKLSEQIMLKVTNVYEELKQAQLL